MIISTILVDMHHNDSNTTNETTYDTYVYNNSKRISHVIEIRLESPPPPLPPPKEN